MSIEIFKYFIDKIFPNVKEALSQIMFMGGELLLYPKKIIRFAREFDSRFQNVKIDIPANLTIFNLDFLKIFKNNKFNVVPSIDRIK
jgi:sulfatase maturation enzyme AslB (radical SAM superfamily)